MVVSGAILQLSAIGAQNAYINSTDYTLFKSGIRAFTNFAAGQILVSPQSASAAYYGSELHFKIPRSGDLMHKLYFTFLVTGLTNSGGTGTIGWGDAFGHALVEYAQIDIGGTKFDKIYSEHLEIRSEQENPEGRQPKIMLGTPSSPSGTSFDGITDGVNFATGSEITSDNYARATNRVFVELPYWFDKFAEQSLPIIALMFHDVDIKVKLRNRQDVIRLNQGVSAPGTPLIWSQDASTAALPVTHPQYLPDGTGNGGGSAITVPSGGIVYPGGATVATTAQITGGDISNPQLCATFIYLDQLERELFAGSGHEYVIQQHQFLNAESRASGVTNFNTIKNFSHPVSEFSLFVRRNQTVGTDYNKNWFDWSGMPKDTRYNGSYGGGGPTKYATSMQLNQQLGSEYRDLAIDALQLALNNHDRLPDQNDWGTLYYNQVQPFETHSRISTRKFFNYSFALRPENLLATGTLNCSRVDNIEFRFVFSQYLTDAQVYIFGRNFNVVKISSGLAGLRFSS
jgi:hypothetical protein